MCRTRSGRTHYLWEQSEEQEPEVRHTNAVDCDIEFDNGPIAGRKRIPYNDSEEQRQARIWDS